MAVTVAVMRFDRDDDELLVDLQVTAILEDGSWTWRHVRSRCRSRASPRPMRYMHLARRWRVENGWRTWIEDGNRPGNLPHIEDLREWHAWRQPPLSRRLQ